MSILDNLENVNETDTHIRAIRVAEFTEVPKYWYDAYKACLVIDEFDLAEYCLNMSIGIKRVEERKHNGSI